MIIREEKRFDLKYDLDLIKAKKFIPKTCSRKKDGLTYTFLKEEIYNKACKIFKTDDFDRLMIVPSMPLNCKTEGKLVTKDWVKDEYKKKDVFVVELNDVVSDLIKYAKENSQDKDSPNAMNRRNFVLELIHTLERQTFCESKTIF